MDGSRSWFKGLVPKIFNTVDELCLLFRGQIIYLFTYIVRIFTVCFLFHFIIHKFFLPLKQGILLLEVNNVNL
jgi:hypothetical protein